MWFGQRSKAGATVAQTTAQKLDFSICVLLLDFSVGHSLSVTNTMFEHKVVHQYNWHKDTLVWRLMIDFVVVSGDPQCVSMFPCVLDTRVKRRAKLSTDHQLVVCWMRLKGRRLETRQAQMFCEGLLGTSGKTLCLGGHQLLHLGELQTGTEGGRRH